MGFPGDFLRTRPVGRDGDRHHRTPVGGEPSHRLRWVPIRSLSDRHRARLLAHLLALPEHDRYLRFGYAPSDSQLSRYCDAIDFERDEVFGIFNRRLVLIAVAHLAGLTTATEAEFGVSVLPNARGRGYGSRLFDHAVLHARNQGVETLLIQSLSENTAMLRIVRSAGATIERDGGESLARLRLPADNLGSHIEELVGDQAAEIDYRLKRAAVRFAGLKQDQVTPRPTE
jgi:ribosomal protein S18 acetylase RimI-like enzyme